MKITLVRMSTESPPPWRCQYDDEDDGDVDGDVKITLVRMSTDSPPMEAPKIVFTIARATTPPSAPVDCEVMMLMRLLMYSVTVLFHMLIKTHLRSPVESEKAKDKDESTETSEGNRVTRHFQRFSSLVEPGRIVL